MKTNRVILSAALCCGLSLVSASAMERYFGCTYEPETMPKGALEYEQWVTLRAGRNKAVGQEHFYSWELREELEYGVTDNYTVALYLHQKSESFQDPVSNDRHSEFSFEGISIEN